MATYRPLMGRRRFLARAGAGLASIGAAEIVPRHVLARHDVPGVNDRIAIGVIGIGIRGKYQIANVPPEGRVVALSDCYEPRMQFVLEHEGSSRYAEFLTRFRNEDAPVCATYQDYRRLIDDERIDAVMITACDHHHVQAAILACQAGKDVYVEKPLSVTIQEGRALVDAARKYGRIVQVGSQQRTMEMNQFACRFIREGGLGTIQRIELPNYPGPLEYDGLPGTPPPAGMNWNLYCGPTPMRPYNLRLWAKEEYEGRRFSWRGWDMWRDYSGHLMTNHAAHSADMAQLALGTDDTGPVEIWPLVEGYHGPRRECPVMMRYADGVELAFTLPKPILPPPKSRSEKPSQIYTGEKGVLYMRRNGFRVDPPELVSNLPDESVLTKWEGGGEHVSRPHIQNWLDSIRSRKSPGAPAETGHRTATICHLANIARQLRRRLHWNPQAEQFAGDDQANRLLSRPRRAGFELPKLT